MGLKNKTSLYDLVPGPNAPVSNMESMQGAPNFDLGNTSTLQPDSLERQLKMDTDLNGQKGPSFDLGRDSMLHAGGDPVVGTSLLGVYNGTHGSPFVSSLFSAPQNGTPVSQDLDGGLPSNGNYQSNGPDGGFF